MSTYVLVSFWTIVIAFLCHAFILAAGKFPVKTEHGIGFYLAGMVIRIPILIWGAYLLWGGP